MNKGITPLQKLKIAYYPKGDITQYFGENPLLYSRFGLKGHNGIDIVRPHGTVMMAIEDCVVLESKENPDGYGKYVRLMSLENDGKYHREWTYGHCHENLVKVGQKVRRGEIVALMGNTGFVVSGATPYWKNNPFAGTHLHLGLRMVRPSESGWAYNPESIKILVKDSKNGYYGSINPVPFLETCDTELPETTYWREIGLTLIAVLNKFINLRLKINEDNRINQGTETKDTISPK